MNSRRIRIIPLCGALLALSCAAQNAAPPDAAQIAAARQLQEQALAASAANAEKLDKAADALILEIQAAVNAKAPLKTYDGILQKLSALSFGKDAGNRDRSGQSQKIEAIRNFTTHWQDYLYAVAQGNFDAASQTITRMIQEAAVLPVIPRSELMALQDKIAGQAAEADKVTLAPLLKRLDETLATANTAADLDALLAETMAAQAKESQAHPNRNNGPARTIQELRQFVSRWQEYLSLRDSGKTQEAQNALRNLAGDNSSYGIGEITAQYRSKILRKLNESLPKVTSK